MKKIASLFSALLLVATLTAQTWQNYTPNLCGWTPFQPTIETCQFIEYPEGRTSLYFGMAAQTQNYADKYVTLSAPSYDTYFGVGVGTNSNGSTSQNAVRVDLVKGSNIARVLPFSGSWTGGGGASMRWSIDYRSQTETKHNIVYMGNSLMNLNMNTATAPNGHYVARGVHTNICDSIPGLMACLTAENGMSSLVANQNFNTKYAPHIDSNAVVINFLHTVDLATLGLSVDSVWTITKQIADKVHALGGKYIVVTMIPRNGSADPVDIETKRLNLNDSIRTNTGGKLDGYSDPARDAMFDQQSDADVLANYLSDKVHNATNGQNRLISLLSYDIRIILLSLFQ